jgi:hypothetical protein
MTNLVSIIQQIVSDQLRSMGMAELGVIEQDGQHSHAESSDMDNYACDVRLKNTGLVLKQVPVATGHIGTAAIPNQGDLVLVAFSHGDQNQPIIIGRLYNDADRPPLNKADEVIFRLPLAKPDDETVKVEARNHPDDTPPREVLIEILPKIRVYLHDDEIVAEAGKTRLTLTQPGQRDGQVIVEAGNSTITIDQDGDIAIEANGNISLTTQTGDVSIEGMNVNIKSQAETKIEAGSQVSLKGNIGATVDGGMSSTLQGLKVTVKGYTDFSQ